MWHIDDISEHPMPDEATKKPCPGCERLKERVEQLKLEIAVQSQDDMAKISRLEKEIADMREAEEGLQKEVARLNSENSLLLGQVQDARAWIGLMLEKSELVETADGMKIMVPYRFIHGTDKED